MRSAVNASVRALDQLVFPNMDVDDYIASFNDSEAKRHNNGDKKNDFHESTTHVCVVVIEKIVASEMSYLKPKVVVVWLYIFT